MSYPLANVFAVEEGSGLFDSDSTYETDALTSAPRRANLKKVLGIALASAGVLAFAGCALSRQAHAQAGDAGADPPAMSSRGLQFSTTAWPVWMTTQGYVVTSVPLPVGGTPMPSLAPGGSMGNAVKRSENLNDGNTCRDTEELYGTLCYRKCSLLLGKGAVRISAFTCCAGECEGLAAVTNGQTPSILPCDGYDISSADGKSADGFSCPHEPGACLNDEEQNWGQCYEKCSILTNHEYPYRTAAATCCKYNPALDPLQCIDPTSTDTSTDLDVGGGKGDGDPSTPRTPHGPLLSQTKTKSS